MASSEITLEAVPSASDIKAADWDACANPKPDPNSLENFDTLAASGSQSDSCKGAYNPFVSHAFFAAAEVSGWAGAYERAGGRYYPKLQASVPFNPATGPRLLIRDGVDRERIGTALASGLMALCNATSASSVHVTFAREAEAKLLAGRGFLIRNDQQFHWHNDGYKTFDDFL